MPDIEINVEETPGEEAEENEDTCLSELLAEQRTTNDLLRTLANRMDSEESSLRQLVPSLLETNTRLTEMVTTAPARTLELLTPLLSPPQVTVVEIPPVSAVDQPEALTEVAPETLEESPDAPPKPRRKYQGL